ncbi:MAG: hypothetical protein VST64_04625 [Nitrospirota bacterium]|nr:hypothetical protein [Nitrospirota bacterium]
MTTQGKTVVIGLAVVGLILVGFVAGGVWSGGGGPSGSAWQHGYEFGQRYTLVTCAKSSVQESEAFVEEVRKNVDDYDFGDPNFSAGFDSGIEDAFGNMGVSELKLCRFMLDTLALRDG